MHYVRNIAVLLLTCLFVGCSQKSQAPETETDGSLEQEALSLGEASQFVSDKQIAVVFGHSYNDERFVSETRAQIASRFGLASEGGLVLPLIFPDDFKNGRIAPLDDMLADYDICGLIVIGAPERTYAVLARLQDSWGAEAPAYPVIMLAPQDDVLGIEAGADLVLDFAAGNETDTLEEQVAKPSDEMPELLFALIRYMYLLKDEFDSVLSNVRGDVLDLLGDSWEITPYIDSETGLYAINHFIIERKKLSNE
jgi:hypothetical protein